MSKGEEWPKLEMSKAGFRGQKRDEGLKRDSLSQLGVGLGLKNGGLKKGGKDRNNGSPKTRFDCIWDLNNRVIKSLE